MHDDRRRGQHAQHGVGEEGGRHQHAVGQVVQRTAHQDEHAASAGLVPVVALVMMVPVALVVVAVAQQRDLLQHEEADQAGQHQREQGPRVGVRRFERLRQQVQQRQPTTVRPPTG